ncbi:MAG TPA: hypothetical protein VGX23_26725 [Actinocrinis sp.]|nr:hypothetical protein [Actinocrinis sp.]
MTQLAEALGPSGPTPDAAPGTTLAPDYAPELVPAPAAVPALLASGHAVSGTFPAAPSPAAPAADQAPTPAELLALATALAAEPGLTDRLPAAAGERTWLALPVRAGLQAWLIAWPAGTGTGWHDHGDARGAMVLVEGRLTERSTTRPVGHADGASLELPDEDARLRRFGAAEGRSFTARHVHEVTNEEPATAYSVHVYYPDLTLMRRYVPSGGRLLPIGTESAGDW